ncbi:PHD finger protein 3 isoform X1 [Hydra vulgaris]|uniref:PHD finger protein 3 isoform X1 n=1 Tax=Hydra vulgaris TaxID=6087 RepID=UPI001F5FDA32|nr:PHD finger protein 3 isoform X1 [Hydra vulgaris]XP_047145709.1 PHD finger protein 3 isoform X1 [Hydra vulgaris]
MAPAMARKTPKASTTELLKRPKRKTVIMKENFKNAEKTEKISTKSKFEESSSSSTKKVTKISQVKKSESKRKENATKKIKTSAKKQSVEEKKHFSNKNENEKNESVIEEIEEEEVEAGNQEIRLDVHERKNHPDEKDSQLGSENDSDNNSDPDDGEQDNDGDLDFDPENDPDKLWCFCRRPHGNRFMICCDLCEDWFHGECVGISINKGREMEKTGEEWCCDKCKSVSQQNVLSSKSPLNSPLKKEACSSFSEESLHAGSSMSNENLSSNDSEKLCTDLKDLTVVTDHAESTDLAKSDISRRTVLEKLKTDRVKDTLEKIRARRRESRSNDLIKFEQVPTQNENREFKRNLSFGSDHSDDPKRKQVEEQIKNKVKMTPTPQKLKNQTCCIREECTRSVMKGSIYCSRECIYKYANESIKFLEEEKIKSVNSLKSPDKMMRSSPRGITVISPATSSTDRVTESTHERIAVFEKSTGKVVAGVMAPTKKYLFAWLEEHPTYEILKPGKQPDSLKNVKKDQDELVRSSVRRVLRQVLVSRCKQDELLVIQVESIGKLCKKIESELLKLFVETNNKYKAKSRSLIFNLRDNQNKILYKRVVSGEITPYELVRMTPEQLATPALAQWREQESKHHLEMVKKRELEEAEMLKIPRVKQTHKGEIEIVREKEELGNFETKVFDNSTSNATDVMKLLNDTTVEHNHHLFDANCKICTGKIAPPGEPQSLGVSTTVVQAEPESSMPSPEDDIDMTLIGSSPVSIDTPITTPVTPASPVAMTPIVLQSKQASVWRGFVMMQKVAKFITTAYQVSGSCENLMQILPDTVHVCGRIPPDQVWEYLGQLKSGRKNKYIDVIRFEMSSKEEKTGYIKLYTYFYQRHRIGVVGNCSQGIKDMYILPLASQEAIPAELQPLPGLPNPRPHMLLGIIVRVKSQIAKELPSDSSPEVFIKRKKKKKDKKKEKELEEQLETQKKLVDIIFQNRTIQAAIGADSLALNSLALLKSIEGNKLAESIEATERTKPIETTERAKSIEFNEKSLEVTDRVKPSERVKPTDRVKKLSEEVQNENLLKEDPQVSIESKDHVIIPDPDSLAKNFHENIMCLLRDSKEKGTINISDQELIDQDKTGSKNASGMFKNDITKNDIPVDSSSEKILEESIQLKDESNVEIPLLGITSTVDPSFLNNSTFNLADEDYALNLIEDMKIPTEFPKMPFDFLKHKEEIKMPELPDINLPSSFKFRSDSTGNSQSTIPLPIPGSIPQVPLPPNIINKLPPGVPLPPLPPQRPTLSEYRHPVDPRTGFRSSFSDSNKITQNEDFERCNKTQDYNFGREKEDTFSHLSNVSGLRDLERSNYLRHEQVMQKTEFNPNNKFSFQNFQSSNVRFTDQHFSGKNDTQLNFNDPPTNHHNKPHVSLQHSHQDIYQSNNKQNTHQDVIYNQSVNKQHHYRQDFPRMSNQPPVNDYMHESRYSNNRNFSRPPFNPPGPMPLPPGPRPMLPRHTPGFFERVPNHEGNHRREGRDHFDEPTDYMHGEKYHFQQEFQNNSLPYRNEDYPPDSDFRNHRNNESHLFPHDNDFQRKSFDWNHSVQHENLHHKPNFRKRHFDNPNFNEDFEDFHENFNSNPPFVTNRPQRFNNRSLNRPPRGRGHYSKWQDNKSSQSWENL